MNLEVEFFRWICGWIVSIYFLSFPARRVCEALDSEYCDSFYLYGWSGITFICLILAGYLNGIFCQDSLNYENSMKRLHFSIKASKICLKISQKEGLIYDQKSFCSCNFQFDWRFWASCLDALRFCVELTKANFLCRPKM